MASLLSSDNITASASTSTTAGDFLTLQNNTWIAASATIDLTFRIYYEGIDYVQEKIKEIFDDRAKIKQYRKSLFTDKIRSSCKVIKKQSYTVMLPPKRNFRGQEAQRK